MAKLVVSVLLPAFLVTGLAQSVSAAETVTYTYDALGRLVKVVTPARSTTTRAAASVTTRRAIASRSNRIRTIHLLPA